MPPSYIDAYGIAIHYDAYPVTNPRGVVQLVHGVGEHAGRYGELIGALNASGYAVWADDHRGHGRTGKAQWVADPERFGELGPGGLHAAVEAVHQFSTLIRDANPGLPLVLLGHSWGSLISQIIINTHADQYDAVILTGTALRVPGFMDAGDLNRKHKHLGATGFEWLSRDPNVAAAFISDPLASYQSVQKIFSISDTLRLLGRPSRRMKRNVPILILVGSDDTLGGERSAVALAKSYIKRGKQSDVELIVYEGARHELFNETNRSEVRADLFAWLDARIPARL